ncbi:unnamed protein product [Microthlaspi erraticum]|uniref:Uncharacterized protein n=1 Tax=Microthlaspi erraticum TaxID=1685480 RepID=A0A6D2L0U8_9BRAS|nr:unnamed protein product [Microthlaspi erraticum]
MVSQLLKSRQGVHAIEDALATNEDTLMDFMGDATEENIEECPPKNWEQGRGLEREAAIRSTPFDLIRAARSSLLFLFYHLFILEVGVASLALVEPGSLEAVVRGPML